MTHCNWKNNTLSSPSNTENMQILVSRLSPPFSQTSWHGVLESQQMASLCFLMPIEMMVGLHRGMILLLLKIWSDCRMILHSHQFVFDRIRSLALMLSLGIFSPKSQNMILWECSLQT